MVLRFVRHKIRAGERRLRTARMIAKALKSRQHPILAQIVPTRRCNLSCAYCNEYDSVSQPVPLDQMIARVDHLASLGTSMIDLSGGEPLLHPDLDTIIRRIRHHGVIAGLLTNGLLLTRERIAQLNRAGLDRLQISIDNVTPDDVSHKSLKALDRRLEWLSASAEFDVNVNTVLGAGVEHPADALIIARRALALGFGTSVGLIHDGTGQLMALDEGQHLVHQEITKLSRSFYSHAHDGLFQRNLMKGAPNSWQCRAGARYLYVCEDGLVHWCSQTRGFPGIPLERYGVVDLDREYLSVKSCAPHCTISCVHRVGLLDELREEPLVTLERLLAGHRLHSTQVPVSVKVLRWMFITGSQRDRFRRLAMRAFGVS